MRKKPSVHLSGGRMQSSVAEPIPQISAKFAKLANSVRIPRRRAAIRLEFPDRNSFRIRREFKFRNSNSQLREIACEIAIRGQFRNCSPGGPPGKFAGPGKPLQFFAAILASRWPG